MRKRALTESAKLKDAIQKVVRQIVIRRDGGCLLKGFKGFACNPVLQADHLISRGRNIGYADTRLIICLCKAHHTAKTFDTTRDYETEIRFRIGGERAKLWDKVKADQKSHPMGAHDWAKELMALQAELTSTNKGHTEA